MNNNHIEAPKTVPYPMFTDIVDRISRIVSVSDTNATLLAEKLQKIYPDKSQEVVDTNLPIEPEGFVGNMELLMSHLEVINSKVSQLLVRFDGII